MIVWANNYERELLAERVTLEQAVSVVADAIAYERAFSRVELTNGSMLSVFGTPEMIWSQANEEYVTVSLTHSDARVVIPRWQVSGIGLEYYRSREQLDEGPSSTGWEE